MVVISSIAAFVLTPGWAAYSASKAAVEQLARSMRIELAPTGATVGVAHFGVIDTGWCDDFEPDPIMAAIEARAPAAVSRTCQRRVRGRGARARHRAPAPADDSSRPLAPPLRRPWHLRPADRRARRSRPNRRELMAKARAGTWPREGAAGASCGRPSR